MPGERIPPERHAREVDEFGALEIAQGLVADRYPDMPEGEQLDRALEIADAVHLLENNQARNARLAEEIDSIGDDG